MLNLKRKRHITVLAAAFALLLSASIAYAAITGALTFQGTVTLSPETSLIFVSNDSRADVSADGQTVTFTIDLNSLSDTVNIPLTVENNGSTTVKIADYSRDYEGSSAVLYSGQEDLYGLIINAGMNVDFEMEFGLDANDPNATDAVHSFKFILDYEMVP